MEGAREGQTNQRKKGGGGVVFWRANFSLPSRHSRYKNHGTVDFTDWPRQDPTGAELLMEAIGCLSWPGLT